MFKNDGRFICFYCAEINGFKGKPEFALAELTGRPLIEIRKAIYGVSQPSVDLFFDFKLSDWWSDEEFFDDVPDLEEFSTLFWGPDCLPIDHPLASAGAAYLAGRGISLEVAQAYGIRYSGPQTRVLFPIQYRDRLFGWQGRLVGSAEWTDPATLATRSVPKALTFPGELKKGRLLMFADRLTGADQAILCEGPVDGIKAHLCAPAPGAPVGNVVTLGKGVSQAQAMLIKYSGVKRVYLALDPDAAAETERLVKEFHGYVDTYIMVPPAPYGDLGEMEMEDVAEVYRNARRAIMGHAFVYLKRDDVLLRKRYPRAQT